MKRISLSALFILICLNVLIGQNITNISFVCNKNKIEVENGQQNKIDTIAPININIKVCDSNDSVDCSYRNLLNGISSAVKDSINKYHIDSSVVRNFNGKDIIIIVKLFDKDRKKIDSIGYKVEVKFPVKQDNIVADGTALHENDKDILEIIKKDYPEFVDGKYFKKDGVNYIFLNEALEIVEGTEILNCNSITSKFSVVIYAPNKYKTDSNSITVNFDKVFSKEYLIKPEETFATENASVILFHKETTEEFIEEGVNITITLRDKEKKILSKKVIEIPSCNSYYNVAFNVGIYNSRLNNPDNIKSFIKTNGDTTLVADDAKSRLVYSFMAIWYPKKRVINYKYSELDFMQKWSICFGTRLSEKLLNDWFLGLNFEFAKGGSFTSGLHYGEHKVIAGYDNFKFGETVYHGVYDNTKLISQHDIGIYFGINIDPRIFEGLKKGSKKTTSTNEGQ